MTKCQLCDPDRAKEGTYECQLCKYHICEDHVFLRPSMNVVMCGGMRHW